MSVRVNPALVAQVLVNASTAVIAAPVVFTSAVAGGTEPYTYWWELGGEGTNRSPSATFVFLSLGAHRTTLLVNDSAGATRSVQLTVTIIAASNGTSSPANQSSGSAGFSGLDLVGVGAFGGLLGLLIGASVLGRRPPKRAAPSPIEGTGREGDGTTSTDPGVGPQGEP